MQRNKDRKGGRRGGKERGKRKRERGSGGEGGKGETYLCLTQYLPHLLNHLLFKNSILKKTLSIDMEDRQEMSGRKRDGSKQG